MRHVSRFAGSGALLLAIAASGCGGGGGSSSNAVVVSGSVQSPGGTTLSLHEQGLGGLSAVPDGTTVELVRLDPQGSELSTVARTTTLAGRYSFNLGQLHVGFANDLAVAAGSGATRMRALATSAAVDVDPLAEATVRLIVQQGAGLGPFTLKEASDVAAAIRLFATTESLQAQQEIAATVDLVVNAVLADPALAAFLAAASTVGQTDEGPGDIGDFFPSTVGDTWRLDGTETIDGGTPQSYVAATRVKAIDGEGVQTIELIAPPDTGIEGLEFVEETSRALVNRGNDDPTDFITPRLIPYDEVQFPLRAGDRRTLYSVVRLPMGEDLDYDGYEETVTTSATRTTVGFEEVTVPAGTFANCARFESTYFATIYLSSGPRVSAVQTQTDWFAPHLGLVSSQGSITTSAFGSSSRDDFHEELGAWQVGTGGKGILPARLLVADVTQADSNESRPGRPGLAFDGTNYLLVTGSDVVLPARVIGTLLTETGVVIKQFDILVVGGEATFRPSVAFDGTNFLVVLGTQIPGSDNMILGVRVSPNGDILDPDGFTISSSTGSNFNAAVAFDGTNYLVAWRRWSTTTFGDIRGALVTPAGTVTLRFSVNSSANDQTFPEIVFGGDNHLVVWEEKPAFETPHLRGARVAPDGTVLDPDGFDVAVGPNADNQAGVAFDGGRYVVTWIETDSVTSKRTLVAQRRELDGTPADPAPIAICTTDLPYFNPTVDFDGANYLIAWQVDFSYAAPDAHGIWAKRLTPAGELLDGPADSAGLVISKRSGNDDRLVFPRLVHAARNTFVIWAVNTESSGEAKDIAGALVYPF